MDLLSTGIISFSIATIIGGAYFFLSLRSRRQKRDTMKFHDSIKQELHIPPTLHPVIDPKVCIGSLSCVKVCPEGDIIGVVNGRATLTVASNCIGHGRCALECPVDAIKLVFGTSERGVDLPEIDEFFESSRPGVHIVGELGGMGLIRNAVTQGLQISKRFKSSPPPRSSLPIAVVGAGPAGLATALGLKQEGIPFRLLDRNPSLGGTIFQYPRQKVVMTDSLEVPFGDRLRNQLVSKEELLGFWDRALQTQRHFLRRGRGPSRRYR